MKFSQGAEFTRAMKKTHTIWLPDMLHYHNELLQAAFLRRVPCREYLSFIMPSKRLKPFARIFRFSLFRPLKSYVFLCYNETITQRKQTKE
ncbi:MAG: hypothetical protein NC231_03595 [Bacillus sp. (in: Bacteria)]|nr:hypothetical protein [Bacillus sp. (in: firmicutes)]MCM1427771.1 hypothetical protein [Eubacterium sp.]